MIRACIPVLILICFTTTVLSQNKGYLKLIDHSNFNTIEGATCLFTKTKQYSVSDKNGICEVELDGHNKVEINISHINFEDYLAVLKVNKLLADTLTIYLTPHINILESVAVTAFKEEEPVLLIPASVDIIDKKSLDQQVLFSMDDILANLPGVSVVRPNGIYGQGNVNLRGIGGNEPARQLVLMDGVPVISDDRAVMNWNRVNPQSIEKIEVVKGPNSALYGANAMGGVIQLFSKRQKTPGLNASVATEYATFNTINSNVYLSGKPAKLKKLDWNMNARYRSSDGYIPRPDSLIESFDVKNSMYEYNLGGKVNYEINENTLLFVSGEFFQDKRRQGIKILDEDGEYRETSIYNIAGGLKWNKENHHFSLSAYYQIDESTGQMEVFLPPGPPARPTPGSPPPAPEPVYSKTEMDGNRLQKGFNANYNYKLKAHSLTLGLDLNNFTLEGEDNNYIYENEDTIHHVLSANGDRLNGNIYIQDRISLLNDKLFITPGLNLHYEKYISGEFTNQSNSPGNDNDEVSVLNDTSYVFITPRLNVLYQLSPKSSCYLSYSRGYRTATFEDMLRTGSSGRGYRIPNLTLKPEMLDNYEIGFKGQLMKKLTLNTTVFRSFGKDFMYLVETGDYVNNGRDPIVRKENFTSISITGLEMGLNYLLSRNVNITGNYTYHRSVISKHEPDPELEGNYLTHTPKHSVYLGSTVKTKIANLSVYGNYRSKQYGDHQNTREIGEMFTMDAKIWKEIRNRYLVYLGAQNLLNERQLLMRNRLPVGRMVSLGLKVEL